MKKEIIHDKIIVYQKDGDIVHQIHDVTHTKTNIDGITIYGRAPGSKKASEFIFIGAKIIFYENYLMEETL